MIVQFTSGVTILSIYQRYQKKLLILPSWQRDDAWKLIQKQEWWKVIRNNQSVCGMITTFTLSGQSNASSDPVFLNDGAQRVIYSIIKYVEYASQKDEFGRQKENWEDVLGGCHIHEQRVMYDNKKEAIDFFFRLNALGTTCTPYELTKGIFVDRLENYEITWQPILDRISNTINSALDKLGANGNESRRETSHKRIRDDMGIFLRYASKDKNKSRYVVSSSLLNPDDIQKGNLVEDRLSILFQQNGSENTLDVLSTFKGFVDRYTALYLQLFRKHHSIGVAPTNVHMRWWLSVAIYHYNNDYDYSVFRKFTELLIKKSSGKSSIYYNAKNGSPSNTSTAVANVTNISTVLQSLGMTLDEFETKTKREYDNDKTSPGFVKSHMDNFQQHGNGDTVTENAVDNSYRLNRDMTKDELEDIKMASPDVEVGV